MTRLYLVGLLGIGAAGMHIKYNQIGRLPLLIKPLELYKDKDPVLSAVKYVENKDKLIEAIKEYTMTYERIILDQVDFFFKTDADASKFWKDLTFLPVEPHSIQVFLRDKPSHFLADKFPSYLVVFYSHTAWNELYNTVKPSPKTVDLDPSNLRSIISELSNSKENKTDNFAPRAIDYFTKGLEGKTFYIDFKDPNKKLGSNLIESASLSSDQIHLKNGVTPSDLIVKEQKRFTRVESPDIDQRFQVYQIVNI